MLQLRKLNDNKMAIGKRIWAIADGYIPGWSKGMQPQLTSHEAICILNTDDEPALIEIIVYFSNRNPMGPFTLTVPPKRTKHLRLNDLTNPESIPHGVDYACTIEFRMFQSLYNIRDWIQDKAKTLCLVPSLFQPIK